MITYKRDRSFSLSEWELVRTWRNREDVRSVMQSQHRIEKEEHAKWVDGVLSGSISQKVKMSFDRENPFGVLTLKNINHKSALSDWGFYIGAPDYRGRGLAKRLLFDLLDWAFVEEKLFRLYTSVLEGNNSALSLYERAGFAVEGCFEKHVLLENGKRHNLYWVAIFSDVWIRHRESLVKWGGIGD